ncbi:hypothetical protein GYMLUDRAFT_65938 [Collybiopsis luxurians FD-317 M1]|nr:hypothetical protein GYMLUDRAFT_65938 [Collybiopsis luxurians FD-317 M1]
MPPNANSVGGAKYGAISWSNYLHIALILISMPLTLTLKALTSFAYAPSPANAYAQKPLKRRISDTVARSVFSSGLSISESQWALGPGLHIYQQWAKRYKLDFTIDKLRSNLEKGDSHDHLLWIGPKRTNKVVLVLPGKRGIQVLRIERHSHFDRWSVFFPATEMMFKFWRCSQLEWEKQGLEIGIAILSYSVLPEGAFPAQLHQATRAIEYLFANGCDPSNLQLVGDSAGGNLLWQLLSHLLHPIPSPQNYYYALTSGEEKPGQLYVAQLPESHIPYAEPILVPDDWYSGLNNIVDRILVSTGAEERFFDQDVVFFEKKIKPHHRDAALEIQEGGLHDDPIMDFFLFDAPLENTLTPIIWEWIAKGFQ